MVIQFYCPVEYYSRFGKEIKHSAEVKTCHGATTGWRKDTKILGSNTVRGSSFSLRFALQPRSHQSTLISSRHSTKFIQSVKWHARLEVLQLDEWYKAMNGPISCPKSCAQAAGNGIL